MAWLKRESGAVAEGALDDPAGAAVLRPPEDVAPSAAPLVERPSLGRTRALLAGVLCLAASGVSALLLLQHHGVDGALAAVHQVCGGAPGAPSGCDVVSRSRFAEVEGVPLAAAGIVFYGSLGALLLLAGLAGADPRGAAGLIALGALALALVADVMLLGVQMVAIRAFCRLCLLTYALGAIALVLVFPARRAARSLWRGPRGDGRLVFAGWVMASLALAAGVYAAEKGLDWRERLGAASILGAPVAPPAPSTSLPPGTPATEAQRFQEEARAVGEQARRLQEILDDPQKLERYYAEKAMREYEQGPVHPLRLEGVPAKGPATAPIKVVEFSDFLCPFCRNIAAAFAGFLPGAGDRVSLHFKNYPLDAECNPHVKPTVHPGACTLALGAVCAQDQGKFWPYHDRVFANPPPRPGPADVARLAGEAGLDPGALSTCMASARAKQRVSAEIAEAHAAGVNATPTLFINGKRLPRVNDFLTAVDKEAARLGLPPLPKQ
jgi:protein-disulfide isomerase/uncharacterized membrane protein